MIAQGHTVAAERLSDLHRHALQGFRERTESTRALLSDLFPPVAVQPSTPPRQNRHLGSSNRGSRPQARGGLVSRTGVSPSTLSSKTTRAGDVGSGESTRNLSASGSRKGMVHGDGAKTAARGSHSDGEGSSKRSATASTCSWERSGPSTADVSSTGSPSGSCEGPETTAQLAAVERLQGRLRQMAQEIPLLTAGLHGVAVQVVEGSRLDETSVNGDRTQCLERHSSPCALQYGRSARPLDVEEVGPDSRNGQAHAGETAATTGRVMPLSQTAPVRVGSMRMARTPRKCTSRQPPRPTPKSWSQRAPLAQLGPQLSHHSPRRHCHRERRRETQSQSCSRLAMPRRPACGSDPQSRPRSLSLKGHRPVQHPDAGRVSTGSNGSLDIENPTPRRVAPETPRVGCERRMEGVHCQAKDHGPTPHARSNPRTSLVSQLSEFGVPHPADCFPFPHALLAQAREELVALANAASQATTSCHRSAPLADALHAAIAEELETLEGSIWGSSPCSEEQLKQRISDLMTAATEGLRALRCALPAAGIDRPTLGLSSAQSSMSCFATTAQRPIAVGEVVF